MYEDDFSSAAAAARKKRDLLSSCPAGYFVSSMMAGVHVGFAVLLLATIGGLTYGDHSSKILMGVSFGIALSLVVIAGSDLFTGTNLVMAAGVMRGTADLSDAVRVWTVCLLGNWAGSAVLAVTYWKTGLGEGAVNDFIAGAAAAKMSPGISELFLRGVLCNILVCLGVWCSYRCRSESGKLIMIFWCVYAFITSGFEHSVANMTMLTMGLLVPHSEAVTAAGYFRNILTVAAGNMVGGIFFVACPYFALSREK
ncbi:MAG: formate/nitrite transporter family protein [Synergistaceae bacterium]|jgi:nitrite transporter NirC|nr:formate/nitrite transporter family protein [Synergistaceae bacterium]